MKLIELELSELVVSEELSRSGSAKQFEERLKSSIQQIGLAEPIKVAPLPTGKYVVVDGTMRLKAIAALQKSDPAAFPMIPAYVMDYDRRYELRYQTDIYQDLLPSQWRDSWNTSTRLSTSSRLISLATSVSRLQRFATTRACGDSCNAEDCSQES